MGLNLTYKLLKKNLLEGEIVLGQEIKIKVSQALTQDTTGTMVYLELEMLNINRVIPEICVAYIDHNLLQTGYENADDHAFIKSQALKYGIKFSKPGNGICHQLHLENFSQPGKILIGSDSHTSTSGAIGMIAIGVGGIDVAIGMATGEYNLKVPKVVNIQLNGKLNHGVTAKDIILFLLKKLKVTGCLNCIIEYSGDGVETLVVSERATLANMGAELGATTSIFPSDNNTYKFLKQYRRENCYTEYKADEDAEYDQYMHIDLATLKPLISCPHSPDNVKEVSKVKIKIDQVIIGSCTNSSYEDLMIANEILKNKKVHPDVELVIAPGSSNVLKMISSNGALKNFIRAGARLLEVGCGPCIGMGLAPRTNGISLRTFNRNFKGRSGTLTANIYLASPATAAYSAIIGEIADPSNVDVDLNISTPNRLAISTNYFYQPLFKNENNEISVKRGPNIGSFPKLRPLNKTISAIVILKLNDNITTDDIIPSTANLLKYRSNIDKLSNYCFAMITENFKENSYKNKHSVIVAGYNYGQGSSREHAAIIPAYLGVQVVIAKSFARIHKLNLINFGVIPLEFLQASDYDLISEKSDIKIHDVITQLNNNILNVYIDGKKIECMLNISTRERNILKSTGAINYTLKSLKNKSKI